ncbi:Adenylate cyclase type 10 [Anthophora retusa]
MSYSSQEDDVVWLPDIIGPIYKRPSTSLREILNAHRDDKCTRTMATFVPDELIYEHDLTKKNFRNFTSVMALFNVTRFFNFYKQHVSAENGGSYALFATLNSYMRIIIEEVYGSQGDLLKFSQDGLLIAWKVNKDEFISSMVYHVILCVQRIQEIIASVKNDIPVAKLDIVISAGEVTFSVIGDDNGRRFIIGGPPIEDLKYAKRICLPGDLVLSSSAWEHCAPSQYEYVIKDSSNVKIIKVLGPPVEPLINSNAVTAVESASVHADSVIEASSLTSMYSDMSLDSGVQYQARVSVIDALRRRLGSSLKTYMLQPIFTRVEDDESLKYLSEVRQISMVSISVIPTKCTVSELISLVDQLFISLQRIVLENFGYICTVNLYEKDISFYVVYGIRNYSEEDVGNISDNAILCATMVMREMKRIASVKTILIGISTGIAFCGIVGHTVRKQYMIFGTPTFKATSLMMISFDKISCDYDTIINSTLDKKSFRSRGIKVLRRFGKCHVYEYMFTYPKPETLTDLKYCYPILDRYQEVEYFKDILDDIGVPGRIYSGLLIEGSERSGKSRLLDAFVTIVKNRQIKLVQLSLHPSYAEKAYAVLYYMFLQLFDAEDFTTIEDRERVLLNTVSEILEPDDLCYLNAIMRVKFPLSEEYCNDTDWRRHKRTIEVFEHILNEVVGRVCILLDDVQHMDLLSWQFLSSALNNHNVILVMTMLEPVSWDNLSQVEAGICQDKRLMNRTLQGIDPKYLAAFACQFLNVIAIPKGLEKILKQRSRNVIGWCEVFLMSALQVNALALTTISPTDVDNYDLVYPDGSLIVKIPAYLTPEEAAPPLHWTQMSAIDVCIPSDKHRGFVETNRDITGLRIDMYNRMNSYEQDFIKCAASLGDIFLRSMVDTAMLNSAPLYTSKGKSVAEMIRLRILECAMIQRKDFHADESVYYVLKYRKTFSDMHHLVTCECTSSRIFAKTTLPSYAYCKVLEFTISSNRKLFYEILSPHEKKDYHTKAVSILEKNARKCNTCGRGSFFMLRTKELTPQPSAEMLHKISLAMQRRGTFRSKYDRRRSIYAESVTDADRRRESVNIRRISILPVYTDDTDDYADLSQDNDNSSDVPRKTKRSTHGSEARHDISWDNRLKEFTFIDYRNCRCMQVINYLFWAMHHHIVNSMDVGKLVKFMMEYSAGLITTAQPIYATKFLASTTTSINVIKVKEKLDLETVDLIANKGKTLILMGDAYIDYGNYSQAKKFYLEAMGLRCELPQSTKAICYNTVFEKMRYKMLGLPDYTTSQDTEETAAQRMELAVYFQRLAMVTMVRVIYLFIKSFKHVTRCSRRNSQLQNERKMAKFCILQSLRAAFETAGGFLEKGRIYLTAIQIFRHFQNLDMIHPLEKSMLMVVKEKTSWKYPEEVIIVAQVYQTVYENRIRLGELLDGIDIGVRICKICNHLHFNKVKLAILPSLIQILMWTKHVYEAVDLLYELYYLSKEDTDYSAITWYYALCMEFLLDASMILESYEKCFDFYTNVIEYKSRTCVLRDPESLTRLTTCLVIWQLRMNMIVTDVFVKDVDDYLKDITYDKFSQICNCIKGLESYLLILKRRINIRRSNDLFDRVKNAHTIIKYLSEASQYTPFVKPFLYLLQSYMELLRGRKTASQSYIKKSQNWASLQENKLILAWVEQNKRTWEESNYNNMAHYWVEHIGSNNGIRWQEIHNFGVNAWSTILYPFPVPVSNF